MAWITGFQKILSESESLNNAQEVLNHFSGTDWKKEPLCALCGNMRHESFLNPDMSELAYNWADNRGYGLVQWTPRTKYWDWAVGRGLEPRSGDSQLARIDYEVENNIQWIANGHQVRYGNGTKYNFSFTDFRTNVLGLNVDQLTESFMWNYEGPNYTAGSNSLAARQSFANRVFNELDFSGTITGSKPFYPTDPTLKISSPWAMRDGTFHGGIDIGGLGSTHPIYATQSGKVIVNQFSTTGGNMVYIQHTGDPYFSRYLHLSTQSPISVGADRHQRTTNWNDGGNG